MCHPQKHLDRDEPCGEETMCSFSRHSAAKTQERLCAVSCTGAGGGVQQWGAAVCALYRGRRPTWQVHVPLVGAGRIRNMFPLPNDSALLASPVRHPWPAPVKVSCVPAPKLGLQGGRLSKQRGT